MKLKIGIFDSGIGGFTILNSLLKTRKDVEVFYLADTKRIPFGSKNINEIRLIAKEICTFFEGKNLDALLIACNTTNACALDIIENYLGVPVFDLINSVSEIVTKENIGVLATPATIKTSYYKKIIESKRENVKVFQQACPEFVPEIEKTIFEIQKHIKNVEIIVVDDNSSDKTFEILSRLSSENIKVFSRKKTKGLASAFLLGLINSNGEIIGWVDSNMTSIVKLFPQMIENLNNSDVVLLSRFIEGGKDERNIIRKWSSYVLNKITKFILRSKINDLSSGIFVMNRKVLLDTLPIASGHGEFMIEFLYNAERKGNIIKDSNGSEVVMSRDAEIVVLDSNKRERAKNKVPKGARLLFKDGSKVKRGDKLVEWDPYTRPIISEKTGIIKYTDLVEGLSILIDLICLKNIGIITLSLKKIIQLISFLLK